MKVRANKNYLYVPVLLDRVDARTSLEAGNVVRVVNLPGCPPCNVMGHAHVYHDGQFAGLVSTASLQPLPVHKREP